MIFSPIYKIGLHNCPHCGRVNDCCTNITCERGERKPEEGDISLCRGCGGMSEFKKDDLLLKLVPFDMTKIPEDERQRFESLRKAFIESKKQKGKS